MSLLPSRPNLSDEADPRVVGLDSEDADVLMSALTSTTARRILSTLHEEPAPPAELAARVDTTLQNAQYHLERLEEAGVVAVVGTAYSEKGREMDVYGPADDPLVIFAGRDESASGIRAAISRLVGGFAALAVGALAIQETLGDGIGALFGFGNSASGGDSTDGGAGGGDGGSDGGAGGDAADATASPSATPEPTAQPATPDEGGFSASEATDTPVSQPTEMPTGATSTPAPEPTGTATQTDTVADTLTTVASRTTDVAASGGDAIGLEPGVAFFLGGATVLVAVIAVAYLR